MKNFLLYLTISLVTSTIAAAGTGVYRTAITLKNGTQEIYPDTIVKRFDYVKTAGNEGYAINVVKTDGTTTDNSWYNIHGMKLNSVPTTPGIYIHNSKQVIVK